MSNLSDLFLMLKGGYGSGNFGHHGRPGSRGGSALRSEAGTRDDFYKARQNVAKSVKEVLEHGLKTGNENLVGYDFQGNKINGTVTGGSDYVAKEEADKVLTDRTYAHIHNHPSSASFSGEDIATFASSNARQMLVVGHDGTLYKLSKPKGWIDPYKDPKKYVDNWRGVKDMINEPYRVRVVNKGEDANLVWKEHSNEVVRRLAKATKLKYERKLPK